GESPFWHAELAGGFLASLAFQVTEDDGDPVLAIETIHFVIEQRLPIVNPFGQPGHDLRHGDNLFFFHTSLGSHGTRFKRGLVSNAVQPIGDHFSGRYGFSLADENKEGGLEG